MKSTTTDAQYEIIFSLQDVYNRFYLPTAFVANLNEEGYPTYARHAFNLSNARNFFDQLSPLTQQLLALIELLSIENLEEKFNSKTRKKRKNILEIIEFDEAKKQVFTYIDQKLDEFLTLIVQEKLPLCLDLNRNDWVAQKQILISENFLLPDLYFYRNNREVRYKLQLTNGKETFSIQSKPVFLLTNNPAWVIFGDELHKIRHINGNMFKPFMSKEEVIIKKEYVRAYFQKFILKIANKTNITTEGFEIVAYQKLDRCELSLIKNFLNNALSFIVYFYYDKARFLYQERIRQKSELEFKGSEVVIHQFKRDETLEQQYIDRLESLGLYPANGKFLELPSVPDADPFYPYYWLIENAKTLEDAGFRIRPPEIEGKNIILQKPVLSLQIDQINDWFDLHGTIQVDNFSLPFQKIAPYLQKGTRLYPLPDGTHFLLPLEWFEKFRTAVQLGEKQGETIRLKKSHFPILQKIELPQGDSATPPEMPQSLDLTDFQPSPMLKATLRPYQLEGLKWLVQLQHNELGGCLADDMGLGKTLQTIAALLHAKDEKTKRNETPQLPSGMQLHFFQNIMETTQSAPLHALIVVPASLLFNWEWELQKFAPNLSIYKHVGNKRHPNAHLFPAFDVILTTYHTARMDIKLLQSVEFEYIVLDESQQIKNQDSQLFKALNSLKTRHRLSLSGTPIENSLSDLWSQMQFINPDLLGSFSFFKSEFLNPIEKQNDEHKKNQLKTLIAPYLLRRTKEAVAQDLPPLTEQVFYSEMKPEQRKQYEKAKSQARNYLLDPSNFKMENYSTIVLSTLMKLRQLAIHPALVGNARGDSGKFEDILEYLTVIHQSGHKALIFSSFTKHLELFKPYFNARTWKHSWLTGDSTPQQRSEAVLQFENDPAVQHFLISIKAGGTGLNLTAADYVLLTDPWWNPAVERQAIARAHRIGQQKNVFAIRFITKDSIEEKILLLQEKKGKLADDVIGTNELPLFQREDLAFLLE